MKFTLKGQSIYEAVVALGLISLVLFAIVAIAGISVKGGSFSKNTTLATRSSEEVFEWLKKQKDENWEDFYSKTQDTVWCFTDLSWSLDEKCGSNDFVLETELKREVYFTQVTEGVKVQIKVYWTDAGGYHEVNMESVLTNWKTQ